MEQQQRKAKHTFFLLTPSQDFPRIPLKAAFCFLCEGAGAWKGLRCSSSKPDSRLRRLCTAPYIFVTSCSPNISVLLMFLCTPLRAAVTAALMGQILFVPYSGSEFTLKSMQCCPE